MNTQLKYRTFDQLLASVGTDLYMYNNENMIEPAQLIKVAQRVSYDLGLRIHGTKEKVLDVERRKAKLPDDFYVLNYALLCGHYKVERPALQGDQRESLCVSDICRRCHGNVHECGCEDTYTIAKTVYGDDSGSLVLVQKVKTEVRVYDHFEMLHMLKERGSKKNHHDQNHAEIKNGYIYTNIEEGKIMISYEGALEDEQGNLLVLDHPEINEYYEYAVKQRILENLYLNGEDVGQKMSLIEPRLKAARNYALTIVNTPNFSEMKQLWEMNRKAQYMKYYNMFKGNEFIEWIKPLY